MAIVICLVNHSHSEVLLMCIFMYICSGQIKSSLIKELADKNWKVRGEALQKVLHMNCVYIGILLHYKS